MRIVKILTGIMLAMHVSMSHAQLEMVYVKQVEGNFDKIYKSVFTAMENNGYYVIFEPNLGKNLAYYKNRWGDDYNKNKFESIRGMVFCSASHANQISNLEPQLLAMCPLHITLIYKEGVAQILFLRPSLIASGTAAEKIAQDLEQDVIRTIESGVKTFKNVSPAITDTPPSGQ